MKADFGMQIGSRGSEAGSSENGMEFIEGTRSGRLIRWGLWASVGYIFILLTFFLIGTAYEWVEWNSISPNEVGDLLAGIFGPISFFWLILGFLQQSSELRLQVMELSRSVEQQKELVSVSRETLNHEREQQYLREKLRIIELQPKFLLELKGGLSTNGPNGWQKLKVTLTNAGGPAYDVAVSSVPRPFEGALPEAQYMAKNYIAEKEAKFSTSTPIDGGRFEIRYRGEDGENYLIIYKVNMKNGKGTLDVVGRAQGENAS